MKNIAIDSDVFVSSEIDTESNHKESKEFVEYILANKIKNIFFFTSIFTFLELACAMIRRTNNKDRAYSLLYRIGRSWKSVINPIPFFSSKKQITPTSFSRNLIDDLIETAIKFNARAGDAIQTQAVLENQIDCFVTWNKKDFVALEKEIKDFRVLSPSEALQEIKKLNGMLA